ncbi:MAG: nucleotide exchange factor GrpE [Deltaproteobacteria bacterium]|jgi:molecular chaperone GrpE|nr:nucleotide exchange factor GrpE [Deltaproteobacteria bacterium]
MTKSDKIKDTVKTEDPDIQKQAPLEDGPGDELPKETAPQTPEEKIEKAEAEAKEAYDRFLRASAELENYKKRTQKEMADFRKYANASLVKELLGVVDNLERAIESSNGSNEEGQLSEGLDLTLKELLKIFKEFHACPIEALGKPFDPCYHQAMMQQETTDQPENVVLNELQKGYMIHDRLLRPAMVVVSKSPAGSGNDDKN